MTYVRKTVSKICGTYFFLATRIPSARVSLIQVGMASLDQTLRDKVGTVTTVSSITAGLVTPVGPRGAGSVGSRTAVVSAWWVRLEDLYSNVLFQKL